MPLSDPPSTPARISVGKLRAARHAPYTQRRSTSSSLSDHAGASNSLSNKPSLALGSRASLRPTLSIFEESQVEDLLGPAILGEDSILSRLSSISPSQEPLDYPSPVTPIDHLRGYSRHAKPLAQEWSTATATTIPELPGDPRQKYPSFGVLPSLCGSSSEFSTDEEQIGGVSWIDTTLVANRTAHLTDYRSFDESETDSDNVSMEELNVRIPLPAPLGIQESTFSSSALSSTDELPTPAEPIERRRIWEVRAEDYVPRPQGVPPRSVASVLEIGMQWERARQVDSPRSKDEQRAPGAVGCARRIYGDGQYLN